MVERERRTGRAQSTEREQPTDDERRLRRWARRRTGWWRLGSRRAYTRVRTTGPRRSLAAIGGVALAVALLLVVSGLALGMVAPATGLGGEEYWISPEADAESPLVATDGPQFGDAHTATAYYEDIDGVEAVTPVLVEVIVVESADASERVIAIGVRPEAGIELYGMDPASLSGTDDAVALSDGAASLLATERDDSVTIGGEHAATVADVDAAEGLTGASPLVLVEFSTLQELTGADATDAADHFVVRTDGASSEELASVYAGSTVHSSDGLAADRLLSASLPLALSVSALLIAVVVGTLFVAITTAMDVLADRRSVRTLSALGIPRRRQRGLYNVQALCFATIGGVCGTALGLAAIPAANAGVSALVGIDGPVASHPLFFAYGLVAAWAIGLCAIPAIAIAIRQLEAGGGRRA